MPDVVHDKSYFPSKKDEYGIQNILYFQNYEYSIAINKYTWPYSNVSNKHHVMHVKILFPNLEIKQLKMMFF